MRKKECFKCKKLKGTKEFKEITHKYCTECFESSRKGEKEKIENRHSEDQFKQFKQAKKINSDYYDLVLLQYEDGNIDIKYLLHWMYKMQEFDYWILDDNLFSYEMRKELYES